MANIKSAEKRVRTAKKRTVRNRFYKSAVKAATKKFDLAIVAGDADQAKDAYNKAEKQLDRAANKGVIHKNTVARRKSRLAKRLNSAI